MIKMNKRNLYWIKYLQVTNNNANSELKYGIDWKNRLYSNCIDCSFKSVLTGIDGEDFSYLKELYIKEKLCFYLLKDFDWKLNKK